MNESAQDVVKHAEEILDRKANVSKGTTIIGDDFKKLVPHSGIDVLSEQIVDDHHSDHVSTMDISSVENISRQSHTVDIDSVEAFEKSSNSILNNLPTSSGVHIEDNKLDSKLTATKGELKEAHKKVNEEKVPTRAVSFLKTLINRGDRKLTGAELRGKKTALLDLIWRIEDDGERDSVIKKVSESNGLTEDEKKELEALLGIGTVSDADHVAEMVVGSTVTERPTQFITESVPVVENIENVSEKFVLPDQFLSNLLELPDQARTPEEKSALDAFVEDVKGLSTKKDVENRIHRAFQNGDILLAEANRLHESLDGNVTETAVETNGATEILKVAEGTQEGNDLTDGVVSEGDVVTEINRINVETGGVAEVDKKVVEGVSEEELRENLAHAREFFASESVKYKNTIREKKKWYKNLATDLGFPGRQMPEIDKHPELIEAERQYMEAKIQLRLKMIGEREYISEKIITQAEDEYEKLQKKIIESVPPLEKGIITKSFEKWAKLPLPARVALSTALITGLGVSLGTVGVAGAVGAGAYRMGRGLAGGVAAQFVGKKVDSVYRKESRQRTDEALKNYAGVFDSDKFEEKERELMKFFESEENQKKRDRLKKAGIIMATGAGVAVGSGVLMTEGQDLIHHVHNSSETVTPSGGGSHIKATLGGDKDVSNIRVAPKTVDAIKAPTSVPAEIEPIKVELSSKGYIDTFSKLQQDLAEKYPNVKTTPPEVAKILDSTPEKLAIKFGFYKPSAEFESAVGMKGDHLIFDKSGNLVLENAKGSQTIFDAKTGTIHEYNGKMLDTETGTISEHSEQQADISADGHIENEHAPAVSPEELSPSSAKADSISDNHTSESILEEQSADVASISQNEIVGTGISHGAHLEAYPGATITDYPIRGGVIHVLTDPSGHLEQVSFNNQIITSPVDGHSYLENVVQGHIPLKAMYQFDPRFKAIRNAYNIMYEKMALSDGDQLYYYRLPIEYQGGRIQLIQQGTNITALLNGEKIGSGMLSKNGVTFQYNDALGKGLLTKNGYELAFEKAQSVLGAKINLFTQKMPDDLNI